MMILTISLSMSASVFAAENAETVSDEQTMEETNESMQTDLPADPSINPDNAQFWREILQKYRPSEDVKQLLCVRYTGGCGAKVLFYEKSEYNKAWELVFENDAYVGKYGIGKTKEGDAKTPYGDFGVRRAFGILPDPGTSLEYIDVQETTYACDEDCEYYNQIIDSQETGHACTGEDMFTYTPEYNYGIETDFNDSNTYPDGSAIFIHCKGAKGFTGGCVALDQEYMKIILEKADQNMRIVIGMD